MLHHVILLSAAFILNSPHFSGEIYEESPMLPLCPYQTLRLEHWALPVAEDLMMAAENASGNL